MKKTTALVISLFLYVNIVIAIPNPAPVYCENMGYEYNDTHCIFVDGESCELRSFYNGECGQAYVQELACVEAGGSLEPGYECCEGLETIGISTPGPDGTCAAIAGSWSICSNCGNGICESWENTCNCGDDCASEQGHHIVLDDDFQADDKTIAENLKAFLVDLFGDSFTFTIKYNSGCY